MKACPVLEKNLEKMNILHFVATTDLSWAAMLSPGIVRLSKLFLPKHQISVLAGPVSQNSSKRTPFCKIFAIPP